MPQAANRNTPTATASPWYSIRQHTPVSAAARGVAASADIFIYGDIGESWYGDTVDASSFVREINALAVDQITVRINSYGGSVTDGIAIHNAIKRHPAQVDVAIDGIAASISSLIAMAGNTVSMAENAMLMVHAPWGGVAGNAADLRDYADMLDAWAKAMSTSYASKSGQTADAMLALLTDGKDHWYTAAEAQAAGFVDAVVSASPESASALAAFDLSRFGALPAAMQRSPFPAASAALSPVATAINPQEQSMPMPQGNPSAAAQPTAAANQPAALVATPAVDESGVRAAALHEDATRRQAIAASARPAMAYAGMADLVLVMQNDHSVTEQMANTRILALMGAGAGQLAGGRVITVEDSIDKRRDAMTNALLVRSGHADDKTRAAADGNPYRGRTLLAIAESCAQAAGIRTEGMEQRQIVSAAFTQATSDFPVLLENVMNKTLLGAYALQAFTWSRFCKRGTVGDFRAHNRYRLGSLGNLQGKNELGEYKNLPIPDAEKYSVTATTKGFIINISREMVINNDLGGLTDQAAAMGRSAARTVESDVYALLNANGGAGPTMADGQPLFHATHNNIATAAAPSVNALDAMRVLMAQQRDVSGNDFLDMRPEVLLCAIGLGGTFRTLIEAEYDTTVSNKFQVPNIVRGLVRDIVDSPRLTGTRYSMLASVNDAPAIEVSFLDGNDTPYLEMESAFTTDGARYKVRLDYGVSGCDWRGAVTNAGA